MAKKTCHFCKAIVIRTVKEKGRVLPDLKLAYICDKCLKGYWCLCEPHGLCHDLCKTCDAKCFEICQCQGRVIAPPHDGVPHHWLRNISSRYCGPYGKAPMIKGFKKTARMVLDGKLRAEDAYMWVSSNRFTENGKSVEEETRLEYLTEREYTVRLECPQQAKVHITS